MLIQTNNVLAPQRVIQVSSFIMQGNHLILSATRTLGDYDSFKFAHKKCNYIMLC